MLRQGDENDLAWTPASTSQALYCQFLCCPSTTFFSQNLGTLGIVGMTGAVGSSEVLPGFPSQVQLLTGHGAYGWVPSVY